ncbi:MAG TPA: hypothetical protein ENJ54_01210 [Chloroflexi bacterium]|nr:hypothetical protein [Chloroflexota bacterium]
MSIYFEKFPQAGLQDAALGYTWSGRVLTATLYHVERGDDGAIASQTAVASEDFDFSSLAAGEVARVEPQVLPVNPVVRAECDANGDLHARVVNWYDPRYENAPETQTEVLNG